MDPLHRLFVYRWTHELIRKYDSIFPLAHERKPFSIKFRMQSLFSAIRKDDGSRAKNNVLILFDEDCLASVVLLSHELLLSDGCCEDISIGH